MHCTGVAKPVVFKWKSLVAARMPKETVVQPLPEKPSRPKPLNLQTVVEYVQMHKNENEKGRKGAAKVATEGTPEEIAGFTPALIPLIQQPG